MPAPPRLHPTPRLPVGNAVLVTAPTSSQKTQIPRAVPTRPATISRQEGRSVFSGCGCGNPFATHRRYRGHSTRNSHPIASPRPVRNTVPVFQWSQCISKRARSSHEITCCTLSRPAQGRFSSTKVPPPANESFVQGIIVPSTSATAPPCDESFCATPADHPRGRIR